MLLSNAVYCTAATLIAAVIYYHRRRLSLRRLPPGPKPELIIGNLRQIPTQYQWLTFSQWGKQYGPLTYVEAVGQPILVVNDHQTAVNLLDKRGQIYSDRHRSAMLVDLAGEWELHCFLMTLILCHI